MNTLARILSLFPFTVNVSGRKAELIKKLGGMIYKKLPAETAFRGTPIYTDEHPIAAVVAYATFNFYRDFEKSKLGRFMQSYLKPNQLFVDIGANMGGYSLLAKQLGAQVHAFEPHPEIAAFLQSNSHAFGKIYPIALGSNSGTMPFYISRQNSGGSSLVQSAAGWEQSGYSRVCDVSVNCFDLVFADAIAANKVFDLVKVDVEGFEEGTITGLKKALEQNLIRAIWCEVRGPKSDRNPNSYRAVCAILSSYGYEVYLPINDAKRTLFDWQHVDENQLPQFFDLLFLQQPE